MWNSARDQALIDTLFAQYRRSVVAVLEPLVEAYDPALLSRRPDECRKMMELSAKMTVVGHACAEVAGYPYDERRQRIATLYGGCCFLADSFIDDFGLDAAREYVARLEELLTTGWFDIRNDREKLFYIIVSRLFAERDVLDPILRQAILRLLEAQKRDISFRLDRTMLEGLTRRQRLRALYGNARDRSGHAIVTLTAFLAPQIDLRRMGLIFLAGSLIMHIDDHGDHYTDLYYERLTYMNQVAQPARALRRIFDAIVARLAQGLPLGSGRDIMLAFLTKYYITRRKKHRVQRGQRELTWAVYA